MNQEVFETISVYVGKVECITHIVLFFVGIFRVSAQMSRLSIQTFIYDGNSGSFRSKWNILVR